MNTTGDEKKHFKLVTHSLGFGHLCPNNRLRCIIFFFRYTYFFNAYLCPISHFFLAGSLDFLQRPNWPKDMAIHQYGIAPFSSGIFLS